MNALWVAALGLCASCAAAQTPQQAAELFKLACLQTQGQAAPAVDFALSHGFEPVDPMRGSTDELLAGQPGSVLAAPGTQSRMLLAAAQGQRCTVWIENMSGPSLRLAMFELVNAQVGKGARAELQVDRNIEVAGSWRSQLQWRYRVAGAAQDFVIGAVTTLADAPGTQALNVAPLPPTPPVAPDGLPLR